MVTAIGGNHHRIDFLIGEGKALDPSKYYIVCTDAIGNGLTTSPSNSVAQPRMQFPRFSIRDMVQSQYQLLTEKLGISHVITVIGPSMGGMLSLQWGVSYPDFMDSLVAMVPLAKSPAWTAAILETMRKAIMLDPEWNNGNYNQIPENGMRLFWDILIGISARNPEVYRYQFSEGVDVLPWLKTWEDKLVKVLDPNDWIYQSWAYQEHDIGKTPGMNGDLINALRSIKARTLILTGRNDLLNPEWEPREAARYIPNVRCVTINPFSVTGHLSASGAIPADVEFLNRKIGEFLGTIRR
jgi:homoserine O-acetyltransferase